MKRGLSFRAKVAGVVLPALVVLLILSWVVVAPRVRQARAASADHDRALFAEATMQFLDGLQTESILAVNVVASGGREARAEFTAQQAETNQLRDAFLEAEKKISARQRATVEVRNAVAAADGLNELRTFRVGGLDLNRDSVLDQYLKRMNNLLTLDIALATGTSEATLVRQGLGIIAVTQDKTLRAHLGAFVLGRLSDNSFDREDHALIASLDDAAGRASDQANQVLGGQIAALGGSEEIQSAKKALSQLTGTVRASLLSSQPVRVTTTQWREANLKGLQAADVIDDGVFRQYTNDSESVASRAQREALLYALLAILGVAAAAVSAYAIGNSLTRRLANITSQAHNVAVEDLPRVLDTLRNPTAEAVAAAIPEVEAEGNDEIASLADSFNQVLRTSVETSIEHSNRRAQTLTNLLVNLGRRNQTLIDRQLDLIDRLESSVEEPAVLEGLFALDHTVTRMRRNAESLLVLAGSRRSRAWSESVHMSEVIRGAISEVADMNRVSLDLAPGNDMVLNGQYAVDLSHLLAELIENATLYSSPASPVSVRVQRNAVNYRVWIIDLGVGMTDDELEAANRRVTDPPDIDELTTDQVGFQVVGRLARRLEAHVRLQNNPAGGVAVSIDLPPRLFESLFPDEPVVAAAESIRAGARIDAGPDAEALPFYDGSDFADDDDTAEPIELPLSPEPEPEPVGALPVRRRAAAPAADPPVTVTASDAAAALDRAAEPAAAHDAVIDLTSSGLAKRRPGGHRVERPDETIDLFGREQPQPRGLRDRRGRTTAPSAIDAAAQQRGQMLSQYTRGVVEGRRAASPNQNEDATDDGGNVEGASA